MSLRGTIEIRLSIAANGAVKYIRIVNSIAKNETAKQCLLKNIKSWQFPGSSEGKDTAATVTLTIGS
jgi:hypothetical protein